MNNKLYFLALNRMSGVGPKTAKKLLTRWPELAELFTLPHAALLKAGLTPTLANTLSSFPMETVNIDITWENTCNTHNLLTWEDPRYPCLLREISDPPMVLYAKGDLHCLHAPCVAMVGTRNPSITGTETAKHFAEELARAGITIVSGLALGIDGQAHAGSLAANAPTVAVMGTGIDRIYPARHRALAEKIPQKGLLLTEFPLNTTPAAGHFPQRNRIISGLSLGTLVIEAAIKSGSLITARLALEQNRDVMAIPGSIHNPQSRGCHHLLQQGAALVTSPHDVLDVLGIAPAVPRPTENPRLATEGKTLVKCMGFEMTTLNQLIQRTGLCLEDVACDLATLELQGIVKAVPGGYMRCIV